MKECRARWRNLRISYLRYLRQCKNPERKVRPYYLLSEMAFMEPFVRHSGDLTEKAETAEEASPPPPPSTRYRNTKSAKIEYHQVRPDDDDDDDDDSIVFTFLGGAAKDDEEENDPIEQAYATAEIVQQASSSGDRATTAIVGSKQASHYGGNKKLLNRGGGGGGDGEAVKFAVQDAGSHAASVAPINFTEKLLMELNRPDLNFFRSILPDVESMTQAQKSSFKLSILSALNNILYGGSD